MTKTRKAAWLLATLVSLELAPPSALASDDREQASLPDAPSASIALRSRALAPANDLPGTPSPNPSPASDNSHDNILLRSLKRGLQDQREIYAAPFHRPAVPWDIGFVAMSGALIAADKHASGVLSRDHLEISRRTSDVGYYATTASAGVLWLIGAVNKDPHAREAGILGLESLANTRAVYSAVQLAAGRERPLEGDGKGHFWRNNSLGSSFPSGHATSTWSTASVIAHEYPSSPWRK